MTIPPVVLDGAQSCQAYKIDYPNRNGLVSAPFYEGSWIVGQPVTCSAQVTHDIVRLLGNPGIYGRPAYCGGCAFDAAYAYRLTGRSGTVIVRIDTFDSWFVVDSFDTSGKRVYSTGEVAEHGHWLALLKETFPRDATIAKTWKEETSQ